jgi:pimeloyl-ACP methyl ester carboxylesterase
VTAADDRPSPVTAPSVSGTTRTFRGAGGLGLRADQWTGPGYERHPDVLMLHGGGQTRHSWKTAGSELAASGYRVTTLDTRGHGESEWAPDGDYEITTLSDDVLAVLDQLGRATVLVGASMGGLTALLAATRAGAARAPALILVDVVPRYEKAGSKRVRDFMLGGMSGFASLDDAADAIAAYLPHRPRAASTSGLRRNLRQRSDGRWYWHWDPAFMRRPAIDADQRSDLLEAAARAIKVPMLLLRGGKSDVVSPEGVRQFLEIAPQAKVVELPAAAHTAAGDDNEAFARAVIGFVGALDGAEPT